MLLGTLLFTAILSFGYFFVSSQWISGVPIELILQWIAASLPDTLVKVLPMASVLMVVVVFGRMAADRELIAAQAGGIHLGRLAAPALLIALAVSGLAVWLSLWVAPASNVQQRALYWDKLIGAGLGPLSGKTLDLGEGRTLYFDWYDRKTHQMKNIRVQQWQPQGSKKGTVVFAESGTFDNKTLTLDKYQLFTVNYPALLRAKEEFNPLEMEESIKKIFPRLAQNDQKPLTIDTGKSRQRSIAEFADAIGADADGWHELQRQLNDPKLNNDQRRNALVTLHRKLALPFANIVLALCALPFALRFGRSFGVSLGLALLISVAYYLLLSVGLALISLMPASWPSAQLGAWFANGLFLLLGIAQLRRS